jgi:ADP-heptose:LPS heptosyltransferase
MAGRSLHRLRRRVRGALLRAATAWAPAGNAPLPKLADLERVLLVHVNFRLGNTLLATSAVAALTEACPATRFDLVGGPAAPLVMRGQRLGRVIPVARDVLGRPWRLAQLVRALRRGRYDAALHLGTATGSLGAFLVWASGAPHRIGGRRARGNVYFTSTVAAPHARHKVDRMREYLAALGVSSAHERCLMLDAEERARARAALAVAGPVAGIFVGARERKGKGWPLASAAAVTAALRSDGFEPVVFLGPEEVERAEEIRRALAPATLVREPDLRRVAALLSWCAVVVTPDAGPMHLAIAAGAPTVAVFRKPNADRWGPRPPHGEAVLDPDGTDVAAVLAAARRLSRPAGGASAPCP